MELKSRDFIEAKHCLIRLSGSTLKTLLKTWRLPCNRNILQCCLRYLLDVIGSCYAFFLTVIMVQYNYIPGIIYI